MAARQASSCLLSVCVCVCVCVCVFLFLTVFRLGLPYIRWPTDLYWIFTLAEVEWLKLSVKNYRGIWRMEQWVTVACIVLQSTVTSGRHSCCIFRCALRCEDNSGMTFECISATTVNVRRWQRMVDADTSKVRSTRIKSRQKHLRSFLEHGVISVQRVWQDR